MNRNKLIAYSRGITNSGIHTGNGTTNHVGDFDKANKSNLIESYIDRKDIMRFICVSIPIRILVDMWQILIHNSKEWWKICLMKLE